MDPLSLPLAIVFGNKEPRPTMRRPRLKHCFSVWLDPKFAEASQDEHDLIRECMVNMIGATNGDIGFEVDARGTYDLRVIRDGARKNPNGTDEEWYSGLAYVNEVGNVVESADIVLNPKYILAKVINHEFGHVLGWMHPNLSGSVMSDLHENAKHPAQIDLDAWAYMREHEPGTLRPGVERAHVTSFHAPRVIVD